MLNVHTLGTINPTFAGNQRNTLLKKMYIQGFYCSVVCNSKNENLPQFPTVKQLIKKSME